MEIIRDIDQGSDEWFAQRIGSIGGSSIASVVAGGQGKTRKTLMYRLVGEILSGEKYHGYSNDHMARGVELEAEARQCYEFVTGNTVEQVGMFRYGPHTHFSPDGDLGDGIIEIKCVIPSTHVETILSDKIPAAYRKQCSWGMLERGYCDFVSYSPTVKDRPIWIKRMDRDIKLIKTLMDGAEKFVDEMLGMVKQIRKA